MYILNIIISNISTIYTHDYRFYRDAPVQNFEYNKPRSEFTKIKKSTDQFNLDRLVYNKRAVHRLSDHLM